VVAGEASAWSGVEEAEAGRHLERGVARDKKKLGTVLEFFFRFQIQPA
jgi:hypothetical protein